MPVFLSPTPFGLVMREEDRSLDRLLSTFVGLPGLRPADKAPVLAARTDLRDSAKAEMARLEAEALASLEAEWRHHLGGEVGQ